MAENRTENRKSENRVENKKSENKTGEYRRPRKRHHGNNPRHYGNNGLKKYSKRNNFSPIKLKLLVTVVNRNKGEYFADLIQHFDVNMQMYVLGEGTANTEMLHFLGLTNTEKIVILSVIREDMAKSALSMLETKFKTVRGGKGIAFTVPLSSVIGVSLFRFLSNNTKESTIKEEE